GEAAHRLDLLGDLDCALDRLGAAGAEEEAIEIAWRQPGEHVAKLDRRKVGVGRRRGIGELARLLCHRLADLLAAVPDIDDVESGETVEIGAAMRVVDRRAVAAHDDAQPIALGKVEPARAVDPNMLERLLLERPRIVHPGSVVGHVVLRSRNGSKVVYHSKALAILPASTMRIAAATMRNSGGFQQRYRREKTYRPLLIPCYTRQVGVAGSLTADEFRILQGRGGR